MLREWILVQVELMPLMAKLLDDAAQDFQAGQMTATRTKLDRVSRSGVTLAFADAERLAELQAGVGSACRSGNDAAGRGEALRRTARDQPAEPAAQPPAPAAAPSPAVDAIEMARKAEAQSLFVEADQAFELRRMNDAAKQVSAAQGRVFLVSVGRAAEDGE